MDKGRVYEVYSEWPELARSGLKARVKVPRRDYRRVYFLGMGGSAAVGDILAGWLWGGHGLEAEVCKGTIPASDLDGSLAIACSASGRTRETLAMLKTAVERNATIVSMSHSGTLASESKKRGIPHIEMPPIVAPRYALPFMVFSCLPLLHSAFGLDSSGEASEALAGMERVLQRVGVGIPTERNPAKRLALRFLDKSLAIYGTRTTRGAGIRFKNEVNENSKKHAYYDEMPELLHNEIQAWEEPTRGFVPVFLRDEAESERESTLAEASVKLLADLGKGPVEVKGQGRSGLSRLLTMVYELEFVSYYMAIGLGCDPSPTPLIDRLKRAV